MMNPTWGNALHRSQSRFANLTKKAALVSDKLASELSYRADLIKYANKLESVSQSDLEIVKTLQRDGIYMTSLEALSLTDTSQMLAVAESVWSRLPNQTHSNSDRSINSHAVHAWAEKIATEYPDIFKWGIQQRLLNIAENYIGLPVAYLGVNIRKDIPNQKQVGTRLWHTDGEDRRMLKAIIYLNDVDENGGPFEYIPQDLTPSYRSFKHLYCKILDEDMKKVVPASNWKQCTGAAGTVILVDTARLFHHGRVPEKERAALFFCYTSRKPKQAKLCRTHGDANNYMPLVNTLTQPQKACVLWDK